MGWANCGTDRQGRPIGYAHEAICDEPDCTARIDRGLAYACGGMHGDYGTLTEDGLNELGCDQYFCSGHLFFVQGVKHQLCQACLGDVIFAT